MTKNLSKISRFSRNDIKEFTIALILFFHGKGEIISFREQLKHNNRRYP